MNKRRHIFYYKWVPAFISQCRTRIAQSLKRWLAPAARWSWWTSGTGTFALVQRRRTAEIRSWPGYTAVSLHLIKIDHELLFVDCIIMIRMGLNYCQKCPLVISVFLISVLMSAPVLTQYPQQEAKNEGSEAPIGVGVVWSVDDQQ